jgi:S1-C subfamily serine protease
MHVVPAALVSLALLAPFVDGWLGIYLDNERTEAVVVEVIPESPAARAGFKAGDVLLAVGDQATGTREEFIAAVRAGKVGERLAVRLLREGKEQVLEVVLGQRPEAVNQPPAAGGAGRPDRPMPAIESAPVRPVTPPAAAERRGYLGISVRETEDGIVVDRVLDGPAKTAGVAPGDRIVRIGDNAVQGLDGLDKVLTRSKVGDSLSLGLRGAGGARTVVVTVAPMPQDGVRAADTSSRAPAVAPVAPVAVVPTPPAAPRSQASLEAELGELRAELAALRQQLEELRRQVGRERPGRE